MRCVRGGYGCMERRMDSCSAAQRADPMRRRWHILGSWRRSAGSILRRTEFWLARCEPLQKRVGDAMEREHAIDGIEENGFSRHSEDDRCRLVLRDGDKRYPLGGKKLAHESCIFISDGEHLDPLEYIGAAEGEEGPFPWNRYCPHFPGQRFGEIGSGRSSWRYGSTLARVSSSIL